MAEIGEGATIEISITWPGGYTKSTRIIGAEELASPRAVDPVVREFFHAVDHVLSTYWSENDE